MTNRQTLLVEAVGLYTQPISFKKSAPISAIALKRFRVIGGEEFDGIMVVPPMERNHQAHLISFDGAASEVASDRLYMELSKELLTVDGVEVHPVRQPPNKDGHVYNYYVVTGNLLAAVKSIELLANRDPDIAQELDAIARVAVDMRGKLIRFPWRPKYDPSGAHQAPQADV